MKLKLNGKFVTETIKIVQGKKDATKQYKTGDAVFNIEYNHEDMNTGEVYTNRYDVPFKVFGDRICDFVQTLKYDDECEIFFEVAGREYQGKYYAENKASLIKLKTGVSGETKKPEHDPDIPFGN